MVGRGFRRVRFASRQEAETKSPEGLQGVGSFRVVDNSNGVLARFLIDVFQTFTLREKES
jgi:hypothetical protein